MSDIYNVPKRQMSRMTGQSIVTAVILGGSLFFGSLGYWLGSLIPELMGSVGTLCGIILWFATYIAVGFRMNAKQEFTVIERCGYFYIVQYEGWYVLCLPGIIDRIAERNTIRYQVFDLYKDEIGSKMDFADDAATIVASAWFCIGNPKIEGTEREWWRKLEDDILRWVYAFEQPYNRVEEILDGEARPRLAKLTIDEALKTRDGVAESIITDPKIKASLLELGAYLEPVKGVIIKDISLDPESEKIRRQRLQGKADADRTRERSLGYGDAITSLAKDLGGISRVKAAKVWETQRALETLTQISASEGGSRFTFIAPSVRGVVTTLGIGDAVEEEKK